MTNFEGINEGWLTIQSRAQNVADGEKPKSGTERLIADQNKRVGKLGEETFELVRELSKPFDRQGLVAEVADVFYVTEVISAARSVDFLRLFDIIEEFRMRGRPSDAQRAMLMNDKGELIRAFGAAAANLAAEDSADVINFGRLQGSAAGMVALSTLALESYGMTLEPVADELAARNAVNSRRLQ